MHTPFDQPSLWIALAMASGAAITDLRSGIIPNSVVAVGAATGVLAQLLTVAFGPVALGLALRQMGLGLALGSILPLFLYAYGALGGGDVKLFAAIGLCAGPWAVLSIELWAHVIALCLVPLHLLRSGPLQETLPAFARRVRDLFRPRVRSSLALTPAGSLCFAPAICAAAFWVWLFEGAR